MRPMSVYAVALIDIQDREQYGKYERGFLPIFEKFGGKLLAVEEEPVVREGSWPAQRTVLFEFASQEAFDHWYDSAEYQELVKLRLGSSQGNIAVLRGFAAGVD